MKGVVAGRSHHFLVGQIGLGDGRHADDALVYVQGVDGPEVVVRQRLHPRQKAARSEQILCCQHCQLRCNQQHACHAEPRMRTALSLVKSGQQQRKNLVTKERRRVYEKEIPFPLASLP